MDEDEEAVVTLLISDRSKYVQREKKERRSVGRKVHHLIGRVHCSQPSERYPHQLPTINRKKKERGGGLFVCNDRR